MLNKYKLAKFLKVEYNADYARFKCWYGQASESDHVT